MKLVWTAESSDYGFSEANHSDDIKREFTRFRDGDYILPLRCYLSYDGEDTPAATRRNAPFNLPDAIEIIFVDEDEPVGISLIPSSSSKGEGCWYTLDGRKLNSVGTAMVDASLRRIPSSARLPKGIYINNGRKVVIK